MGSPLPLDVLLAIAAAPEGEAVDGGRLIATLAEAGVASGPARLLHRLLQLEGSGHVEVTRPAYRFGLTDEGRQAVVDLSPGEAVELTVVMVDLVGFVAYTGAHGDQAGAEASQALGRLAETELRRRGGRIVKHLGDGVLGCLPPDVDPVPVLTGIATSITYEDGSPWPVRAAARRGSPICLRGDLYGTDVNVVSRLCELAEPGEALLGFALDELGATPDHIQRVAIRGLADPVPIVRIGL